MFVQHGFVEQVLGADPISGRDPYPRGADGLGHRGSPRSPRLGSCGGAGILRRETEAGSKKAGLRAHVGLEPGAERWLRRPRPLSADVASPRRFRPHGGCPGLSSSR